MTSLSEHTLRILRATAPLVTLHSEEITATFYPLMFGAHPELLELFNLSNHRVYPQNGYSSDVTTPSPQQKTLADTIVAYATNIDKLEKMSEIITRVTHKHCAVGVQPRHYQIVHDTLMEAIGKVLGDVVTVEVSAAWSDAILYLGQILIDKEDEMYRDAEEREGGWRGLRPFVVDSIIDDTHTVRSIRVTPADGMKISTFSPGQYITVFENPTREKYFAPRHYTLTSQPNDPYYQISVKKMIDHTCPDDHTRDGVMSHYLHNLKEGDEIHLGPIFGPSLLELGRKSRAAVFISIGIGITPTIAMLSSAIKERPFVAIFHGDYNRESHPFTEYLESFSESVLLSYSYSHPGEEDTKSKYYSEGRLTSQKILKTLKMAGVNGVQRADYFLCCGRNATKPIVSGLRDAGVEIECLHVEFFAPFDASVTE